MNASAYLCTFCNFFVSKPRFWSSNCFHVSQDDIDRCCSHCQFHSGHEPSTTPRRKGCCPRDRQSTTNNDKKHKHTHTFCVYIICWCSSCCAVCLPDPFNITGQLETCWNTLKLSLTHMGSTCSLLPGPVGNLASFGALCNWAVACFSTRPNKSPIGSLVDLGWPFCELVELSLLQGPKDPVGDLPALYLSLLSFIIAIWVAQ